MKSKKMSEGISVVIPVYNEEEAVVDVIRQVREVLEKNFEKYEIVVVDDASTDNTAEILKDVEDVSLIGHYRNEGAGGARKSGIANSRHEIIVMIDADTTYPADRIPELVKNLNHFDMVVGARQSEKGKFKFLRIPAKFFIKKLAEFITARKIPDLNSGLRAFRKKEIVRFFDILPNTHSFVSSITVAYMCNNYRVKYIPCNYYKRVGKSTFHPLKDTLTYINLIIFTVLYFRPLKFFGIFGFAIGVWGVIRLILQSAAVGHVRVREGVIMLLLSAILIIMLGLLADMMVKLNRNRYAKEIHVYKKKVGTEGEQKQENHGSDISG
ncbi:MAG: glycosyltransferase family 2 protein [Elusimicrobiota bacterium]